uniref:hypothetical protein n=1 Tax=Acinetobacter ursingii TaxID=108980 RepID=UPI001C09B40E
LSIDNSSFYTLLKKNEKVKKFLFCYTLVLVMVIFSLSVFFLNSLFKSDLKKCDINEHFNTKTNITDISRAISSPIKLRYIFVEF